MGGPIRWWRERSSTERFDLYTRWSLYLPLFLLPLFAASLAGTATGPGREVRTAASLVFAALVLVQTAVCFALLRETLARRLGGPPPHRGLVAVALLLVPAGSLAGVAALPGPPDPDVLRPIVLLPVTLTAAALAALSPLVPTRALAVVTVLTAAGAAAADHMSGGPSPRDAAVFALLVLGFTLFTYRFSVWMLDVVHQLDRGRTAHARLAVAEERLRFSRDLHDVLGRNLSVIAVKSELAAQLARRDPERAVPEMLDVRRVAHESLREVRDVVRGYRSADLNAELAGARSVLRSAGVECRVIGDGADVPEPARTALAWTVREATTNVIRHSAATTCTIELDLRPGRGRGTGTPGGTAVLRMENDGAGTPSATEGGIGAAPAPGGAGPAGGADSAGGAGAAGGPAGDGATDGEPTGSGLAGLAERLADVGGALRTERDGRGCFVLEVTVPLAAGTAP